MDFIDTLEEKMACLISQADTNDFITIFWLAKEDDITKLKYSLQQNDYTGTGLAIYGLLRRYFLSRAIREAERDAESK